MVAALPARLVCFLLLALSVLCASAPANAQKAPPPGKARFLMDMTSGKVLVSEHADTPLHPASLTKMMTIYLTLEAVHRGRLSWTSRVPISKKGFNTPPYKFALPVGAKFSVREAVEGMIVISANDAAQSMCDYLAARAKTSCGRLMTQRARSLGMGQTTFRNGSGLPEQGQVTTARDMARLAEALIRDFPEDYTLFKKKYFKFRGMTLRGHNSLVYSYPGMDGLKTGFTDESGYNLVSSAERKGRRLIGVVLGGTSGADRASQMAAMMDAAFGARPAPAVAAAPAPAPASAAIAVPALAYAVPQGKQRLEEQAAFLGAPRVPGLPRPKPGRPAAAALAAAPAPSPAQPVLHRSAWEVQLAAVDQKSAALTVLRDAKSVLGSRYQALSPLTVPVNRGDITLIRARLTGFANKQAAIEACRVLIANTKSCFVVGS